MRWLKQRLFTKRNILILFLCIGIAILLHIAKKTILNYKETSQTQSVEVSSNGEIDSYALSQYYRERFGVTPTKMYGILPEEYSYIEDDGVYYAAELTIDYEIESPVYVVFSYTDIYADTSVCLLCDETYEPIYTPIQVDNQPVTDIVFCPDIKPEKGTKWIFLTKCADNVGRYSLFAVNGDLYQQNISPNTEFPRGYEEDSENLIEYEKLDSPIEDENDEEKPEQGYGTIKKK